MNTNNWTKTLLCRTSSKSFCTTQIQLASRNFLHGWFGLASCKGLQPFNTIGSSVRGQQVFHIICRQNESQRTALNLLFSSRWVSNNNQLDCRLIVRRLVFDEQTLSNQGEPTFHPSLKRMIQRQWKIKGKWVRYWDSEMLKVRQKNDQNDEPPKWNPCHIATNSLLSLMTANTTTEHWTKNICQY